MSQIREARQKCRNSGCQNRYDQIIGGGKPRGSICIPCLYAEQLADQGQTPDQVERIPKLMEMFATLLGNTGWTWQHIRISFSRLHGTERVN